MLVHEVNETQTQRLIDSDIHPGGDSKQTHTWVKSGAEMGAMERMTEHVLCEQLEDGDNQGRFRVRAFQAGRSPKSKGPGTKRARHVQEIENRPTGQGVVNREVKRGPTR